MNAERAFQLSSVMLAASAFTGLALTGELPAWVLALGAATLLFAIKQSAFAGAAAAETPRGLLYRLSRRTWTVLMLIAFILFLLDVALISQDLLLAGARFLVVLMAHKLFVLNERKDYLHLYAVSLLQLLAAAVLTVELWYGAIFVAYLLAAIWTLLLYHLRNETEEAAALRRASGKPPDPVLLPGPITGRFFWTTNGIAVGAFCLTLLIFFLTPRIGAGFFNKNRVDRIRTSGFSEQVDLGAIGSVKLDERVVMRVEFPGYQAPPAERLYFRGAAYDFYDGSSWSNSFSTRRPLIRRDADGVIYVAPLATEASLASGLRQDILIEALDTAVLFGVPSVDAVKGMFQAVFVDGMQDVYLAYPPTNRFQYQAFSTPERLHEEDRTATAAGFAGAENDAYLQLPELSPRVAALARQVTGQAGTPYGKVMAIEQHLRSAYQYSLDVGATQSDNPVEDFLFARKTGYCEHYATAMVVLLRSLGIPARLATGFLPGEWNDFGNYYTVRQRDAHAWVEVRFPRSGWITFDPTPSVAPPASWFAFSRLGKVVDSVRLKWDRYVIQYSLRDQMAVAQGVRSQGDKLKERALGLLAQAFGGLAFLRTWLGYEWHDLGALKLLALAVGAIVLALLGLASAKALFVRARRQAGASGRDSAAIRLYQRMLQTLAKRGLAKSPGATPWEFARQVARDWAEAGRPVDRLTDLYCRVRFGQQPLTQTDLLEAESILTDLQTLAQARTAGS
jgi:hypothetical protein